MIQIDGIVATRNEEGEITHVLIDVKKQRELAMPALEQLTIAEKSKFQEECKRAISVEQAKKLTLDLLEQSWKK